MNRWLLIWSVICTQSSFATSLEEMFKDAIACNYGLKASYFEIQSAVGEKYQAIGNALPSASVSYDYKHSDTTLTNDANYKSSPSVRNAKIKGELSLSAYFALKASNKNVEAKVLNFLNEKQTLLMNVFDTYKSTIVNFEIYEAQAAQIDYLQNVYTQENQKLDAGASTLTNVAQAKSNLDKAIANQIEIRLRIVKSLNQLQALTGKAYKYIPKSSQQRDATRYLRLKSLSYYKKTGASGNLKLRELAKGLEAQSEAQKAAQSRYLPYIVYEGAYSETDYSSSDTTTSFNTDNTTTAVASIGYSFGGDRYGQLKTQASKTQVLTNNLNDKINQFYSEIANAYASTQANAMSLSKYEQTVASAKISLNASRASFDAGAATILDVLDSLQDLMDAETSTANARYDYIGAYINLRQLAGEDMSEYTRQVDRVLDQQISVANLLF